MERETKKRGRVVGQHILLSPPYTAAIKRLQERLALELKKKTGNRRQRVGMGQAVEWLCDQVLSETDDEFAEFLKLKKQMEKIL